MVQLTLIYRESFEDKAVNSAIWLGKTLLNKLVNYSFRDEITFLEAGSDNSSSLRVGDRFLSK